jgi:hypothetical protein
MPDVTIARLREVAGPKLYAGNAFRLTGLPTSASRQDVLHRKQQLATMRQLGLDDTSEDAYAALDRILGDPRRRLVEELFWMWDEPGIGCQCPPAVHRSHDTAVRAHSAALDLHGSGDGPEVQRVWQLAGREWQRALSETGFWEHVRQRIAALDDRQLDESVVDELREEIPIALVKPLIQLAAAAEKPAGLARLARDWPVPAGVVEDQLEAAAAALYDVVDDLTTQAADLVKSGKLDAAADLLYKRAMPVLERLSSLATPSRHRRTAKARNDVAIVFNNCATALLDQNPAAVERTGRLWLSSAAGLASDPHTVQAVEANRNSLGEVLEMLESIQRRVREFVALGRPDLARQMLLEIKRDVGDVPGIAVVDRLLAELGHRPSAAPAPQGVGCGVFVVMVLIVLVVVGLFKVIS